MSPRCPIRVTYVVPDLRIGGAERHVTTLMSQLDRERFRPAVICLGQEGDLFGSLAAAGVPAVALGRTKRQALRCLVELVRELRATSPDVVLLRGYNAEMLGRVAAVLAGVPRVVIWVHNCGDLEPRGGLRRLGDTILERRTDAYFGVAQAQLPYLVDELHHPPHKVRIIHNGVDPAPFHRTHGAVVRAELGLEAEDLVVGILAALRPEKDHENFLRAAAVVADHDLRARFLVVGDGPGRPDLERLTDELGIRDRVRFTGARADVAAVLAAMDVFVLSSFTIECFPMALLEAMASARPAVCTAVGGVPELLEDGVTGYLVPPGDPTALAGRLVSLLGSQQQREQFGAAARSRVEERFSLSASVRESERRIVEVVETRRPGVAAPGPLRLTLVLDETWVGGVEVLMLEVFRNFAPDVVKPRLICLRRGGPLAAEYRDAGFPVDVIGHEGRFDPRTLPRLVKTLAEAGTDAVLVTHHHRASLALGRLAARLAGVPVNVLAVHDMDLVRVGKRCLPGWAVATLRVSHALVLLAPTQGAYLHQEEQVGRRPWSRTREVIIPNGVLVRPLAGEAAGAAARQRLGLSEAAFVVGIVARLSPQKAHEVLIEAFAGLREGHPESRLVVVGGGDREAQLRELVARLGLTNSVLFTGVRRDVPDLLPALDVSCLSSVHEGVPIAAIESMAAGLPMVVTDSGALRDIVIDGEHGFVVAAGDSRAMTNRLVMLAEDPALRRRLGLAARRRVEDAYRIEQTARGYEELLVGLVGRRRMRRHRAGT